MESIHWCTYPYFMALFLSQYPRIIRKAKRLAHLREVNRSYANALIAPPIIFVTIITRAHVHLFVQGFYFILIYKRGAVVEWSEQLDYGTESRRKVVSSRQGFAMRRLENSLCRPSSEWVPFSN